ncbi:EAL domain-containing protein [Hoeflea sp. G2-23]|uniref:EAL domain-containing protein n=1 Tax=Hoeflea algicola TaxID=2983763 RepID=A0ABT3Z8S1_9HYPH|nr:EAL domain-containing protein [Hoeflea algicola]MCY0148142.1 EAL domain-containing protein [Hoeflea algicola]
MLKQTRNRWFDWGAEFSFSIILLGLLALGGILILWFQGVGQPENAGYTTSGVLLIGIAACVPLFLLISVLDLKSRLKSLGKDHARVLAQSERDALTGVFNREKFVFEAKLALETRSNTSFFALFLADIDHFKQVNDSLGHPAGDTVLVHFAEKLRMHFPGAQVGRLGGDEFGVLIEHSDPITAKYAHELCAGLESGLSKSASVGNHRLSVSASIGIALAPYHGKTWSSLFINADMALYASKKNGRACATLFQEEMLTDIRNEKALVRELRAALLLRHLRVAYQPIVDANGRLVAFEALLRWRHALRGVIPPDIFIPVAERALMIGDIGDYVLSHVCEDMPRLPDVPVNVNLSANQIAKPDLKAQMLKILAETGTDPHRIILEITESASLAANPVIAGQISALQDVGFRIALDDFGMGYSEFNQLRALPYDVIKIDKSYIRTLGSDHVTDVFVSAVVEIARCAGNCIVAEGIETEADLMRASAAGCDRFQGYYFGKPSFIEDMDGSRLDYGKATPDQESEREVA